jgi:hypothetical protein
MQAVATSAIAFRLWSPTGPQAAITQPRASLARFENNLSTPPPSCSFLFLSSARWPYPPPTLNILLILYSFAFWLRSSVVSVRPPLTSPAASSQLTSLQVLFSLISETILRDHSRLFLFLKPVAASLGLLTGGDTVSSVLHHFRCTRLFR